MPLIFSKDIYPFSDCVAVGDEEKRYGEFRPAAVRESGDSGFEISVPVAGSSEWSSETVYNVYTDIFAEAAENLAESVSVPLFYDASVLPAGANTLDPVETAANAFLEDNEMSIYLCIPDNARLGLQNDISSVIDNYIDKDYYSDPQQMTADDIREIREEFLNELNSYYHEEKASYLVLSDDEAYYDKIQTGGADIEDVIRRKWKGDRGFREKLFEYIDESGMTDVGCYKKANVSKQTFSKIKSDKNYHPAKETVMSFIIALELDELEANELMRSAGYAFTDSDLSDVIVKCFIDAGVYDIYRINELLFRYDRKILG